VACGNSEDPQTAPPRAAFTEVCEAVHDTFVWSELPTNNFGGQTLAEVGRGVAKLGGVAKERGLLFFDLSALPSEAIITGATLRLFVDSTTSQNPLNLDLTVWRLAADFDEGNGVTGVTWQNQPAVETSPANSATMTTAVGDWFEMDVSDVFEAVWESAEPTEVWLRVGPTEETTVEARRFRFRTKEYGTGTYLRAAACR
jgi:hypothetical protein